MSDLYLQCMSRPIYESFRLLTGEISVSGFGMSPGFLEDQSRIVSDSIGRWHFLHLRIGESFVSR